MLKHLNILNIMVDETTNNKLMSLLIDDNKNMAI